MSESTAQPHRNGATPRSHRLIKAVDATFTPARITDPEARRRQAQRALGGIRCPRPIDTRRAIGR